MRVSKWGNSLAVRLPASIVEAMGLQEGDDVDLIFNPDSPVEIARSKRREEALEAIRAMRVPLPPGYKFDREDAHARGR